MRQCGQCMMLLAWECKKDMALRKFQNRRRDSAQQNWDDEVVYRIMMAIAAAVLLTAAVFLLVPSLGEAFGRMPCALRAMTGLYCPGCGGTRALIALMHGQLLKSLYCNAAVPYTILFAAVYMISHTLKHITRGRVRGIHYRNRYCYVGLLLLVGNCIWKNYMLLARHIILLP